MKGLPKLLILSGCFLCAFCDAPLPEAADRIGQFPIDTIEAQPAAYDRFGRLTGTSRKSQLFTATHLDSLELPPIEESVAKALARQLKVLDNSRQKRNHRIGNLTFDIEQMRETINILLARSGHSSEDLHYFLKAHQIWGRDRRGNVEFTGYFTPIIQVKRQPDDTYRYPIYRRPLKWEGALPSRRQIDGEGVLRGRGLEIAYANNRVDIYYMQLQGSGYVEYPDGTRKLLSYGGTNRKPYRSIEKFIIRSEEINVRNLNIEGIKAFLREHPQLTDSILFYNPSYTFFRARHHAPLGAGGAPLTPDHTVAVDRRYLPLGSCLLAAVPVYDRQKQRFIGHEWRFLFAQDVGGAIKGPGHVDLYCGSGPRAGAIAGSLKHYGRIYLLLPKTPPGPFTFSEPALSPTPRQLTSKHSN